MLYGSIAEIYDRYRPSYGSAPFDLLRSELKTFDRVVDLGAGTGHVTRSLLTLFSSVTAVEPDSRMARRLPSCDGLTVIEAFAENVDFPNSSLDAVVSGTALHWMDVHLCVPKTLSSGGAARWIADNYETVRTEPGAGQRANDVAVEVLE